ncbi:MAG: ABC transporter ATP-binding protein [Rectinemataceae bacterium]
MNSQEAKIPDGIPDGKTPMPLVSMRGIIKHFPNVIANDSVDLDLFAGEVHVLLGENGAGKSTLMKILYGFYGADSGTVRIHDAEVRIRSPLDARNHGIGMVFQSFTLIPAMTVAENIALYLPELPRFFNIGRIEKQVEEMGARYNLRVDPHLPVRALAVGDQQKVEILKLLVGKAKVLIFDEATSVLAPHEIEDLFGIFSRLKSDGYSIVFITHKMREVLACADKITVMRRGRIAGTVKREFATEAALVALMFGDAEPKLAEARAGKSPQGGQPVMELVNVGTRPRGAGTSLTGIQLRLGQGEIVGVAGVSGNGQRELVDTILGLQPCDTGSRMLFGKDATAWTARRIRAAGVGFVPDDPLAMAVVPWMSLPENMALGNLDAYARAGGFSLAWDKVRSDIASSFENLGFEALPLYAPVRTFSGGQVQRSVLARELGRNPELLVAFYPTRGLDVRSTAAAGRVLLGLRDEGGAVLLVSEDLDELYSLSDRLVVIHKGRIVGDFRPDEMDRHEIGHLMTGSGGSV